MAASGASDDGDRLARKRQPAAPQEEDYSSGAPNYDDADFSVSSGAEEESMRSRSPRSEPQWRQKPPVSGGSVTPPMCPGGSDQKRQPAAPQPEPQPR